MQHKFTSNAIPEVFYLHACECTGLLQDLSLGCHELELQTGEDAWERVFSIEADGCGGVLVFSTLRSDLRLLEYQRSSMG